MPQVTITASTLYHAAAKLDRRIRVTPSLEITWLDGQPAPSAEVWEAAVQAILTRKIITAEQFANLFTETERHEIQRKAGQSVGTFALAPKFSSLHYRFTQIDHVHSDHPELVQVLDFLQATSVITPARRARIAAFLPPEA